MLCLGGIATQPGAPEDLTVSIRFTSGKLWQHSEGKNWRSLI